MFTLFFKICLVSLFFHAFFQKGYWYRILILQFFWHTDTDTYSVFFRLNTDTDTSVFENHTGYWILEFSFCTGQVSALFRSQKSFLTKNWNSGHSVWRLNFALLFLRPFSILHYVFTASYYVWARTSSKKATYNVFPE